MTITGLLLSTIYILVASGFNLQFNILLMINFAHGTIYMWGAYIAYAVTSVLGLSYYLGIIAAILFTFCLGWACEKWLLRGEIRRDILAAIILTLGLLYVFESSALLIFGERPKGIPSPLKGVANIGGAFLPLERLLPAIIAICFMVSLYLFLRFTKIGQSLRAVADDRETAKLMGINIDRVYGLGFAVGAGMAGAAGALVAPLFIIEVGMGGALLWKCFVVAILGGIGSLPGVIVAGLLLGLLDSFLGTLLSATMASIVEFLGIIAILMFRPQGLMGYKIEV
jgi:branched-chain amino acid transport system permease protein